MHKFTRIFELAPNYCDVSKRIETFSSGRTLDQIQTKALVDCSTIVVVELDDGEHLRTCRTLWVFVCCVCFVELSGKDCDVVRTRRGFRVWFRETDGQPGPKVAYIPCCPPVVDVVDVVDYHVLL